MAKKHDNTFFFKLEPSQLLSALILIPESERGAWITKVAVELATKNPVDPFAKQLFDEAQKFKQDASERSRQAGLASAEKRRLQALSKDKQKSTDVEQPLTDDEHLFDECQHPVNETQPISISISSSISSSSTETETTEEKEKTCPEPSDSEPAYQIILKDKTLFDVSEEQVDEWEQIYTGIDVRREFPKMVQWCVNNPKKRKTRDGCIKFICNWLGRDGAKRANENPTTTTHPTDLFDELVRDAANKNKRPVHQHEDDHAYQEPTPEQIKLQDEVWARMMGK